MAYTVTPYVFTPPGPSFDLTLHEKAIWSKIWVSTTNLDDYPDRHEVLGLEFYIDHRMYEGHGTHWNAKYYNIATNKLLFESDFDIPEPSTKGYTYWTWYRIFSWIGHCSWEINEPMNIRVDVIITSNIMDTAYYEFTFTVTTEIVEEGKATIVDMYKPSSFTPNVSFHIKPKVRNDGASDTLFMGLTNTDTGKVLKDPNLYQFYTPSGNRWEQDWIVTLVQTTDFHGKVEVGHVK